MKKNIKILSLDDDPYDLFNQWFSLAKKKEINDPNAMSLSTVGKNLRPSTRMVLMKSFNNKGLIFNTNMNSIKAIHILNNANVCLNFHWKSLDRQIRIEGKAIKIISVEADYYFNKRPEESKIGAWASNQSKKLLNRKELEKKVKIFTNKYKGKEIPRPKYWSGYRVVPNLFEFWQGMPFRLHDRLEFKKINSEWKKRKLYP